MNDNPALFPSIVIRPALQKDAAGILEIYNDAILTTTAVYTYEPMNEATGLQWFGDKQKKGLPFYVAEAGGGRIAGFASYGPFRDKPAYKYSVEHSVYVHRDFRQQGIAKRLLAQLIATATQQELHTIVAGIDADNSASVRLHEQFGFKEVGHLHQVGYKFGKWLDLKFMQLILQNNLQPNEK